MTPARRPADEAVPTADGTLYDALRGSATGDGSALAEFYRLSSPLLFTVAKRRLSDLAEVEAVLVSVYTTAWRRSREFTGSDARAAWVWTLALLNEALVERDVR